ncbi:short chain dehydrogenase reductase family [Diaporthe amygdali]|uniref:short chain dehydrogenase reductase family n=1 Tax=Phomopsis amygdali TaxID=1214568 RepID=UPI0022FE41AA|nr:short chain dehydrogenase reductase family [Diaporthe amygdali]KAJ0120051.1 short chain dehydrogenase reductase family [Diaporthe amygdali]
MDGKVVLVTGGAKGIGRMISEGFVTNGAKVYISSRDGKACDQAAEELTALGKSSGGSAASLPADLQSLDACKALAAELGKREPAGLDVLVNNSGAAWGEPLETHPDAAWTKLLTLNLQRVFTLTQLLIPLLEKKSSSKAGSSSSASASPARIINIGSIDALRVPTMENYAYSASKAGLHHLTRTLAVALGPRGVTVNTLACGPFPSKMMRAVLDSAGDAIAEANPLGRIGTPQDAAGACLFLCGRAGAFVNGATLALDGGVSLLARL